MSGGAVPDGEGDHIVKRRLVAMGSAIFLAGGVHGAEISVQVSVNGKAAEAIIAVADPGTDTHPPGVPVVVDPTGFEIGDGQVLIIKTASEDAFPGPLERAVKALREAVDG